MNNQYVLQDKMEWFYFSAFSRTSATSTENVVDPLEFVCVFQSSQRKGPSD